MAFVLHRATWLSTCGSELGPQASLRSLSPLQPEQRPSFTMAPGLKQASDPSHTFHSRAGWLNLPWPAIRMPPSLTEFTALRQFLEMPYGLLFCRNGLCQWHFKKCAHLLTRMVPFLERLQSARIIIRYDRFGHSMGGARGKYSRHQQKTFAVKDIHDFWHLFSSGNVHSHTTSKDFQSVESYPCIFFMCACLFRWLNTAFIFTSAVTSQSPVSLETVTKVTYFCTAWSAGISCPAAWVAVNKRFSFGIVFCF